MAADKFDDSLRGTPARPPSRPDGRGVTGRVLGQGISLTEKTSPRGIKRPLTEESSCFFNSPSPNLRRYPQGTSAYEIPDRPSTTHLKEELSDAPSPLLTLIRQGDRGTPTILFDTPELPPPNRTASCGRSKTPLPSHTSPLLPEELIERDLKEYLKNGTELRTAIRRAPAIHPPSGIRSALRAKSRPSSPVGAVIEANSAFHDSPLRMAPVPVHGASPSQVRPSQTLLQEAMRQIQDKRGLRSATPTPYISFTPTVESGGPSSDLRSRLAEYSQLLTDYATTRLSASFCSTSSVPITDPIRTIVETLLQATGLRQDPTLCGMLDESIQHYEEAIATSIERRKSLEHNVEQKEQEVIKLRRLRHRLEDEITLKDQELKDSENQLRKLNEQGNYLEEQAVLQDQQIRELREALDSARKEMELDRNAMKTNRPISQGSPWLCGYVTPTPPSPHNAIPSASPSPQIVDSLPPDVQVPHYPLGGVVHQLSLTVDDVQRWSFTDTARPSSTSPKGMQPIRTPIVPQCPPPLTHQKSTSTSPISSRDRACQVTTERRQDRTTQAEFKEDVPLDKQLPVLTSSQGPCLTLPPLRMDRTWERFHRSPTVPMGTDKTSMELGLDPLQKSPDTMQWLDSLTDISPPQPLVSENMSCPVCYRDYPPKEMIRAIDDTIAITPQLSSTPRLSPWPSDDEGILLPPCKRPRQGSQHETYQAEREAKLLKKTPQGLPLLDLSPKPAPETPPSRACVVRKSISASVEELRPPPLTALSAFHRRAITDEAQSLNAMGQAFEILLGSTHIPDENQSPEATPIQHGDEIKRLLCKKTWSDSMVDDVMIRDVAPFDLEELTDNPISSWTGVIFPYTTRLVDWAYKLLRGVLFGVIFWLTLFVGCVLVDWTAARLRLAQPRMLLSILYFLARLLGLMFQGYGVLASACMRIWQLAQILVNEAFQFLARNGAAFPLLCSLATSDGRMYLASRLSACLRWV